MNIKSHLTQMEPRDALPHVQSTIALYIRWVCIKRRRSSVHCWQHSWPRTPSPSVVYNRPTTVACLSHSATVLLRLGLPLPAGTPGDELSTSSTVTGNGPAGHFMMQGRRSHRIIGGGHKRRLGDGSPPVGFRGWPPVGSLGGRDEVPQKLKQILVKLHIIFALKYNEQQLLLFLDKMNLA